MREPQRFGVSERPAQVGQNGVGKARPRGLVA
jgi:hypothetical protein